MNLQRTMPIFLLLPALGCGDGGRSVIAPEPVLVKVALAPIVTAS